MIDLISRIRMYDMYGLMYPSYYLHIWILLASRGNAFSSTVDCLIIRIYTWYNYLNLSVSLACSLARVHFHLADHIHEIHQIPTLVIKIQ